VTDSAPDPRVGRPHVAALDGLRGIAAVAVAIRHSLNAIPMAPALRRSLFESPLAPLLTSQGAVQLFFVLSGFVLAASLARGAQARAGWLPFWARRVFRIHPPYVFAVLVAWIALGATPPVADGAGVTPWVVRFANADPARDDVLASLALPGIAANLLPVGWTLTVEMIYSFAMPIVWIAAGFGRGLPLLLSATLLLLSPWRIGWYGVDFALGAVAWVERAAIARAIARLAPFARALVPVAGVLLLVTPLVFFPKSERLGVLVDANDAREVALMGIGAVLLVVSASTLPRFARTVGARPFAFLGRISFSVYLLHHTLLSCAAPLVLRGAAPLREGLALVALVVGGSIALAVPAHRFVEVPAMAIGQRVARRLALRREVAT